MDMHFTDCYKPVSYTHLDVYKRQELAHTILRGAVNKHGEAIPNYHYEDLRLLWEKYQEKNLKNPEMCIRDSS